MTATNQKIPIGYKQTEVGVIPSDWEVKQIKEIASFTNGKAHEQFIDDNGDYTVINSKFISTEGQVYKNSNIALSPLKLGEIAMVMSDIPNGKALAKCFIVDKDNKYTLNQRICSIKSNECDNEFLFWILNRNKYFLAFDSGTGQTNLKRQEVLDCPILLPPTKAEQTAIATALSDADNYINSLEKLIAKKRDIKQGAMQKLLTPKKGWEVKKLGDVAEFKNGKAHEQFIDDYGKYIVINSKFISTGGEVCKHSNIALEPLYKGEIALVMSDIPNGKALAKCYLVNKDTIYTLNQRICSIKSNECDNTFLYRILNRNKYFLAFDSGTGQTNLKRQEVLDCPVLVPPTKAEQTAIATIISDMDTEIEGLEKKLDKAKLMKQGMMQELLTGKIRLI